MKCCTRALLALAWISIHGPTIAAPATSGMPGPTLRDTALRAIVESCTARHGAAHAERIARGVHQVAALWRDDDGDLDAFCRDHFVGDDAVRAATARRFEAALEQLDGHILEMGRELRRPTDLELGPLLPVDPLFAAFDAGAHLLDDLFASKLAFVALLNFPLTSLEDRLRDGASWSRDQWAEARLTGRFQRRVPADVLQRSAEVQAAADLYIAEYNLWMHHVLAADGARVFPRGKKLISHWNLRDELKAQYAQDTDGLTRQRVIVKVMERIVTQTIPQAVIHNPRVDWNPFTNVVTPAPADTVEDDAPPARPTVAGAEPSTRYAHLLAQFRAARAADPFSPNAPDAIRRAFELGREMPEARVRALLEEVLMSPLVPRVSAEIERRLGRALEPQDLWFDGFKARAALPESSLDAKTRRRYPSAEAFQVDMPRVLRQLGFSKKRAAFLAERIVVEPARGAGHALQAARRGDSPRLRTRVEPGGMDYKGFNIAVHELGHNVEQVFSLYANDHTLLAGVPNNAFTEAIAFLFQARDLELLGVTRPDAAHARRETTLADFWATWEIAGVALVDLDVWHWMYAHPAATPDELRDATTRIASDVWRRFYAPVLGPGGQEPGASTTPLLGIYSHMVAYPLYLADYPLGHLIAFQLEEHLERALGEGRSFGAEVERMTTLGNIAPDLWMERATGKPVSAAPLLEATARALNHFPRR